MAVQPSDLPTFALRAKLPLASCSGGLRVLVHASLPAYSICVVLLSLARPREDTIVLAIVHGPVLWLSAVAHELAKASAALALGVHVADIVVWPLGGLTHVGSTADSRRDIAIACAGPLSHVPIILALFTTIVTRGYDGAAAANAQPIVSRAVHGAMWLNVGLAVLHCVMPAFPFDAARIAVDVQLISGVSAPRAAATLIMWAMPCFPALIVYGFFALSTRSEAALLACTAALWVVLQARTMFYCRQLHVLEHHPLFEHLPRRADAARAPAAALPAAQPAGEPAALHAADAAGGARADAAHSASQDALQRTPNAAWTGAPFERDREPSPLAATSTRPRGADRDLAGGSASLSLAHLTLSVARA